MNTSIETPVFKYSRTLNPFDVQYVGSALPVLLSEYRSVAARYAFLEGFEATSPPYSNTGGNGSQPAAVSSLSAATEAFHGIQSRLDKDQSATIIDTLSLCMPLRALAPDLIESFDSNERQLDHWKARSMDRADQLPLAIDRFVTRFPGCAMPSDDVMIDSWINELYADHCAGKVSRKGRGLSHVLAQLSERLIPALNALGLHPTLWSGGRNGFQYHAKLVPLHWNFAKHGNPPALGHFAVGGIKNKADVELCQLHLTGEGCSHLAMDNRWSCLYAFSKRMHAYISRIDIAFDDFEGVHGSVEGAWLDRYEAGDFKTRGAGPAHEKVFTDSGSTLSVGKRQNGKRQIHYEKGKQLGDADSPWVRIEASWYKGERDLDLDMILNPDHYFAGAYPCNAQLLQDVAPVPVSWVVQKKAAATIKGLCHWGSIAYGKLLDTLMNLGMSSDEVVAKLRTPGIPSRLSTVSFTQSLENYQPG